MKVAFEVLITNQTSSPEPLARVGLDMADPAAGGNQEVAAISYSGVCVNFSEPGGTLQPGQTMSYQGTASGVTPSSVLTARLISTPDNYTLASVQFPIGRS